MARNTPKKIDKRLKEIFIFKAERLRRNPDFWKDMQLLDNCFLHIRYNVKGSWNELKRIKNGIYKKYNVRVNYPVCYDDVESIWKLFDIFPIRVIPYKPKINIWGTLDQLKKSEKRWQNIIKKRPEEDIKYTLRDGRYLTLEIDTHRDVDTIERYIRNYISNLKKEKKRYGLEVRYEASPHLKIYKRYFAVYDYMTTTTPYRDSSSGRLKQVKHTYKMAVLALKKEGWYKDLSQEKAETQARQDFKTASKILRNVKKRIKKKSYASAFDLPVKVSKESKDHWNKILDDNGLGVQEDAGYYKGKKSIFYKGDSRTVSIGDRDFEDKEGLGAI